MSLAILVKVLFSVLDEYEWLVAYPNDHYREPNTIHQAATMKTSYYTN
jgi:hypothetical protein